MFGKILLLLLLVPSTSTTAYELDPEHSHVGFAVRHLGVANVRGRFEEVSATILIDEARFANSSVNVMIATASVNSGSQMRDAAIRSSDVLDTTRFPEISFRSTRIEVSANGYVAVGDLTIRGVTREVRLPFTITGPVEIGGRRRVGIEAELAIDRRDFGMTNQAGIGTAILIGNQIKIQIDVEAAEARPS